MIIVPQDDTVEDLRAKSATQMATEAGGGHNPNAAAKKRKVAAATDSSARSFAGSFGVAQEDL